MLVACFHLLVGLLSLNYWASLEDVTDGDRNFVIEIIGRFVFGVAEELLLVQLHESDHEEFDLERTYPHTSTSHVLPRILCITCFAPFGSLVVQGECNRRAKMQIVVFHLQSIISPSKKKPQVGKLLATHRPRRHVCNFP